MCECVHSGVNEPRVLAISAVGEKCSVFTVHRQTALNN